MTTATAMSTAIKEKKMKDESKSGLKTIIIALILMAAVFFWLYKMEAANTAMHSHDGGAAHSH